MKYTSKKLPDSIIEAEVILDHREFLNYYQPIFDRALEQTHLKGFRPGAAPKEMAERAIDKGKIFEEAVSKAIQSSLKEMSEENSWQLIDQPKIEVLPDLDPLSLSGRGGGSDLPVSGGLKYKAVLSIFPEIRLPDYKRIAAKILKTERREIKVEDKEINDSIKWILDSRAKLIRVARPAEKGDVADIDFQGFLDGRLLDGASGKADSFVLGEGKFVPGFEENLIGRKEGDRIEFSVVFPEVYWKPELRDKKVDFKVSVQGVFEREIPALTDEVAKGLGKFENVEDLKKNIREGLTQEKNEKERERLRLKIMDRIIEESAIEPPKIMLESVLDSMMAEYKEYAKLMERKEKEDDAAIRKSLEKRAKNNLFTNLVLYAIAKAESLEPVKEEVEAETGEFLKRQPNQSKKIDPKQFYDYIYGIVKNKKVFEFLESQK